MKNIARIMFVAFSLSVPFLLYGYGAETWRVLSAASISNPRWQMFIAGALAFVPTFFVARRLIEPVWNWLATFEHELTHLIFGLLFFKLPVGFRVTAYHGGEVKYISRGTTGETWITLAPYFFPTVSIFAVLIAWAASFDSKYLPAVLGWTTAFHLVTNWAETSFRQPDIKKAGFIKTLIVLPVMNLICYGIVLAFVGGGTVGMLRFLFPVNFLLELRL